MTKEKYIKRMKQHEATMDRLWRKIVDETNEFIKDNPEIGMGDMSMGKIEDFSDDLCLKGAWIQDRINGLSGLSHNPLYKRSLTKKIRKVLGFTF